MGGDFDKTEINKEEMKYSIKDKKFFQKISEKKLWDYIDEGAFRYSEHDLKTIDRANFHIKNGLKMIQKNMEEKAEMGYYNLDFLAVSYTHLTLPTKA